MENKENKVFQEMERKDFGEVEEKKVKAEIKQRNKQRKIEVDITENKERVKEDLLEENSKNDEIEKVFAEFDGKKIEVRYIQNVTENKECGISDLYRGKDLELARNKNKEAVYEVLAPGEVRDLYSKYTPEEIRNSLRPGIGGGTVGSLRLYIERGDIRVLNGEKEFKEALNNYKPRNFTNPNPFSLDEALEELDKDNMVSSVTIPSRLDNYYIEAALVTLMQLEIENAIDRVTGQISDMDRMEIKEKYTRIRNELRERGRQDKQILLEVLRKR